MLVAPVIHTFLKQALQSMGITVKDTNADPKKKAEEREKQRFLLLANKYLLEEGDDTEDPGKVMLRELIDQEEAVEEEPMEDVAPVETIEEEPTGLMARG
jgi:signal transduction protein with GAF and PtsI domain